MSLLHDRLAETSSSNGMGPITLDGATTKFKSFSSRYAPFERFYYCINNRSATEFEVGIGYLKNPTTLIRLDVYESTNNDGFVNFTTGVKEVFATIPAKILSSNITNAVALAYSTLSVNP